MNTDSSCSFWYVMRTTYGRERRAVDYMQRHGARTFFPTKQQKKVTSAGKVILQETGLLPNLFFLYATEEEAKSFAYDNTHLPFLRFYYNQHHDGTKEPLKVSNSEIESLRILSEAHASDILFVPDTVNKFQTGQRVRIIDGAFKGITGIVSRWHGQQRVGLNISGISTVSTAYVPTAFLEKISE